MNFQPLDLPALLGAVTWPLVVVVAFTVFRRPLSELVGVLGQRARKFSFGGASLELAEMKPSPTLDTEIRQLAASSAPQSGVTGISTLLNQLKYGGRQDYIVIDLGSETSRRWLTSRLYILALLITLLDLQLYLVFVETVGSTCKRFLGFASPGRVRLALARNYGWLEAGAAGAYGQTLGTLYCVGGVMQVNPTANFQFDSQTGPLSDFHLSQFLPQFLQLVRLQLTPRGTLPNSPVITSLRPTEGPVGMSVTITGDKFGDSQGPKNTVTFNGIPAAVTTWSNTQIVATVPGGGTTGNVIVTASDLSSNGVAFMVGISDSNEWVLLPNGELEHTKWLTGQRIEYLLGSDLVTFYLTLPSDKTVNDLVPSVLKCEGQFVVVVDPDKTFRGLLDRTAVLEKLAKEFSKQASSNKS